jgi:peptidoglycan/xylan/chitin deacetylase (PgdA/CDA1 family)
MLTFHRGAPSSLWARLPNRDFYLNLDYLDALLSYLRRRGWEIVTIDTLLARIGQRDPSAKLVNFSIDDCYRDTWEHVVPLFRRHRAPVTLFVTTGIPDGTMSLGWAGLEAILLERNQIFLDGTRIELPTSAKKRLWFKRITADWSNRNFDREYERFCLQNGADIEVLREEHAITWDMLKELRNDPLVEIGSHTVSHPRMSMLTPEKARAELVESRERLTTRLGIDCRHFAFPYGRKSDCGSRDFSLAKEAGFVSAATTRKGLVSFREDDVFRLPRNTVNGAYQSIAYASVLLSGLAGIGARVTGRV